jgi:hypothetical protein
MRLADKVHQTANHSQFKRLRSASNGHHSNTNGSGVKAEEDDDEYESDQGEGQEGESNANEETEQEEDELNEEEAFELQESSRPLNGSGVSRCNQRFTEAAQSPNLVTSLSQMEAEMGVIEKINLTNFMCHDRLEVSLGSKLNFIIGHNGSEYYPSCLQQILYH